MDENQEKVQQIYITLMAAALQGFCSNPAYAQTTYQIPIDAKGVVEQIMNQIPFQV